MTSLDWEFKEKTGRKGRGGAETVPGGLVRGSMPRERTI